MLHLDIIYAESKVMHAIFVSGIWDKALHVFLLQVVLHLQIPTLMCSLIAKVCSSQLKILTCYNLKQILNAIQVAERVEKPPVGDLFADVYDTAPSNLIEQEKWLREAIKRHPQDYPSVFPL